MSVRDDGNGDGNKDGSKISNTMKYVFEAK